MTLAENVEWSRRAARAFQYPPVADPRQVDRTALSTRIAPANGIGELSEEDRSVILAAEAVGHLLAHLTEDGRIAILDALRRLPSKWWR